MPDLDGVVVTEVTEVTSELVDAWARLMPQLSSRASAPTAEWLEEIVASDSVMFVAYLDHNIVGSLTLVLTRIPVGLKAWIDDVVVDENVRGRRIGEKMSLAAVECAKNAGARNINLESRPSREAANKLYARIGFKLRETNIYRYEDEN